MNRPSPEAVALAKKMPPQFIHDITPKQSAVIRNDYRKWAITMEPHLLKNEFPFDAAIRILAAECDALEKERDALLEALRAISVADWKTAGELRGMARIAAKGAQQ